jgi:hypothetical protein
MWATGVARNRQTLSGESSSASSSALEHRSYLALAAHKTFKGLQHDHRACFECFAFWERSDARSVATAAFCLANLQGMTVAQKAGPFLFEATSGKSHYTKLLARISQEEDGYMVEVTLLNETKPGNSAWGEELVDSFETASELVAALAGEFSIGQGGIEIEIRMHNHKHGTRH